jgi:ABC-type sugar transport system permease subunit
VQQNANQYKRVAWAKVSVSSKPPVSFGCVNATNLWTILPYHAVVFLTLLLLHGNLCENGELPV